MMRVKSIERCSISILIPRRRSCPPQSQQTSATAHYSHRPGRGHGHGHGHRLANNMRCSKLTTLAADTNNTTTIFPRRLIMETPSLRSASRALSSSSSSSSSSPLSLSSSSSTNTYYHQEDGDDEHTDDNGGEASSSITEPQIVKAQLYGLTGSDTSHTRLLSALERSLAHLDSSASSSSEDERSETLIQIANQQWKLGLLDEALRTQKRLFDSYTSLLARPEDDCEDVSRTMHEVGRIHLRIGKRFGESQRWLESALEMKRRLYQSRRCADVHAAGGINSIGAVGSNKTVRHREIGRTLNALALLHLQVLSSGEHHEMEDHEDDDESIGVALSLMQEAESHYRLHGTTGENGMDDIHQDDLMEPNATIPANPNDYHPDLAAIYENMAMLHRRRQNLNGALEQYEAALQIREMLRKDAVDAPIVLEEETTKIVALLMDVADCLGSGGEVGGLERYEEALEKYREALKVHATMVRRERIEAAMNDVEDDDQHQDDHSLTIQQPQPHNYGEVGTSVEGVIRHNIGNVHAQKGEFELSLQEYETSLAIKIRLVGEDHVEVAHTLNAIGALIASHRTSDAASSLPYFREALRVYRLHSPAVVGMQVAGGGGEEDQVVWSVDDDRADAGVGVGVGGGGGSCWEDDRVQKTLENIQLVEKNLGMSMPNHMSGAATRGGSRF